MKNSRKYLKFEGLEGRSLMASDVAHNFFQPHDVNDNRIVSAIDAIQVINHLNLKSTKIEARTRIFQDVNDDQLVTALDALLVINSINQPHSPVAASSSSAAILNRVGQFRVQVELETTGVKTELAIKMDEAPANESFPVTLNGIDLGSLSTDARGRGKLVIRRGDDRQDSLILPSAIVELSVDMPLVIGELVSGRLGDIAKLETRTGGTPTGSNPPGTPSQSNLDLVASFAPVGRMVRSAEYEQEQGVGGGKRKFEAEIEHAAANSRFAVTVAGVQVGTITTDARGRGKLLLSSQPDPRKEQPLPTNFPVVAVGSQVTIGDVSSAFRTRLVNP